jgi:DNA-binding XRE family transcriptional regulator
MAHPGTQAPPASPGYVPRPRRRPGRKPKGSVPVVVPQTPDEPDPDHVLTWRQRKILQVIRDSVRNRGYPPSMQEIADAVGLTSTSSVLYQLSILQRKGYLHRDAGRPRTMEVRLPGRPPVRPPDPVIGSARGEQSGAIPSSRELIISLASRRAELGLSQAEVARRMQTSRAAVVHLEAQLSALARYTEALGLLAGDPALFRPNGHTCAPRPVAPCREWAHLRPLG